MQPTTNNETELAHSDQTKSEIKDRKREGRQKDDEKDVVQTSSEDPKLAELSITRPGWQLAIGKTIIFMTILCWLFIGILVICAQMILSITCKLSKNLSWRRFHKKLIGDLLHLMLIPPICILYYWNKIELRLVLGDKHLTEIAFDPMVGLLIPNHSNDLDYLFCFVLADQMNNLGSYKSIAKNELKYVPIFGLIFWLSDVIFVKRDWLVDRLHLGTQMSRLLAYRQCLLGLFAEGTRWTEDKHKASVEWARSRGLEPLKHHLYPRKRGFNFAMRHYISKMKELKELGIDRRKFRLFNIQILCPNRPDFNDFMNGRKLKVEVYIEEVSISEEIVDEALNSRSEEECPKLDRVLIDIFKRKDELVEEYRQNNFRLPLTGDRGLFPFDRRRVIPFYIWLACFMTFYTLVIFLSITFGSLLYWSFVASFVIACILMQRRIASETQSKNLQIDQSKTKVKLV